MPFHNKTRESVAQCKLDFFVAENVTLTFRGFKKILNPWWLNRRGKIIGGWVEVDRWLQNFCSVKDEQTKCISATAARAIKQSFRFLSAHCHVRPVVLALKLAEWWINHKTTFPTLHEVFLLVMAHLMSSAQIEGVFSAASLVLPSNRGSMDTRFFQAQLCVLVSFLHLVHPEDMYPKSMSAKEGSEALPAHSFGVPYLYPERFYDDSDDEGYDSA